MLRRIPVREVGGRQCQRDRLRLAWCERDAREAAQLLAWSFDLRVWVADVELHDLVARARPAVRDVDADVERAASAELLGARAQIAVGEARVAEAMAEGVLRLSPRVHVGAAVAEVIVHHRRELLERCGPGLRETAAGVGVAEEDVREGIAELLTGVGHVQDRGRVAGSPRQRHRIARDHDDHRPWVRRDHPRTKSS